MTGRATVRGSLLRLFSITVVLVAAACGGSASPTAVPTPTSPPLSSSALEELGLSETYVFNRMGFSMAYPAGWLTGSSGITRLISEFEEDHEKAWPNKGSNNQQTPRATKGYQVSLSRMSKLEQVERFSVDLGSLGAVMGFYSTNYTLSVPSESNVAQTFRGEPALRVAGTLGFGRVVNCIVGHDPVFMFLFCLGAASEQALAEFMPTWEQMLASIKPVGE